MESEKVAIVGAGWAGLQTLQSLKELGVEAEVFESRASVGGTWTTDMSYHGLQVHSPMFTNLMTFKGQAFPFKGMTEESLREKLDAGSVREYLESFAEKMELKEMIHLNSKVKEIRYHSKSQKAYLLVESDGAEVEKGPYRLVVFSSFAAKAAWPKIPMQGFEGKLLHSSQFKEDVMEEIIKKDFKVLVVGGGKSGCDMICAFQKKGYKHLTWLFRAPYWFLRYAPVTKGGLKGVLFLCSLLLFLFSYQLPVVVAWLIGYLVLPKSEGGALPQHFDGRRFHFGILDDKQVDFVEQVPAKQGEPKELTKEGMQLESGEMLKCDVVIYATGYETGWGDLKLLKDGEVVEAGDAKLYHHAVVPNFPCLMSASTAFFQFGPCRALTTAQYITWYLQAAPSEAEMVATAQQNWSSQSAGKSNGFRSDHAFTAEFLLFYLDLWRAGMVSIFGMLKIFVDLFVISKMSPLVLTKGTMPAFPK